MSQAKNSDITPPTNATGDAVQSKVESKPHPPESQAPMGKASLQKAKQFLELIKSRRTIYALGDDKVLEDKEIIELVENVVKETPSSYNSQSSRVVFLFGQEHKNHWEKTIPEALKAIMGEEGVASMKPRFDGFKAGYGTILFFEDQAVIKGMQEKNPAFAPAFPKFSSHSTGMAQVHAWTALELAGYGANLQHMGAFAEGSIAKKYNLPETWTSHAEIVFGSVKAPAGEKTYMDDAQRFKIFGSS